MNPFGSCIQYSIMVHLNITMEENLYRQLKAQTPPKKMSAFIADAVRAKLRPSPSELEAGYRAAAKERWRRRLADDWSATEVEAWPG